MISESDKNRVRVPKQQRSIEKKNRIMQAAERLFAERGFYSVNSNQIAAEAGVSVGSFYSYFKDKKTLLLDILTQFHKQFQSVVFTKPDDKKWGDWGLREVIRYYVQNTLKAFELSPDFFRVTYSMIYHDPEVKAIFDKAEEKEKHQILSILTQFEEKISVNDMEAAVMMVYSSTANVIHRLKLLQLNMDETRLIKELVEMLYRYLRKDDSQAN